MARAFRTLDEPVDPARDHIRGSMTAPVTLVAYSDYECPWCLKFREIVLDALSRLGDRMRVAFRHFPLDHVHPRARLAAEAAEAAAAQGRFWEMHDYLYAHQRDLTLPELQRAAEELGLDRERFDHELAEHAHAGRIEEDVETGRRSGVTGTPTLFINGIRYDGAWDLESLLEAIEAPLGIKADLLARRFANWAASGGITLLAAALVALIWTNSPWGASYEALWTTEAGLRVGEHAFSLSLREWINDGLMVIFFLIVVLEVKRELTMGELTEPRRAALPIIAAIGGIVAPALIYLAFNAGTPTMHGWGVPVPTDTAFALGLLTLFGRRVSLALIVFVTALSIADDIGAILVLAIFYTSQISFVSVAAAAGFLGILFTLQRAGIRRPAPYVVFGIGLWIAVLASGIHPSIAGVLLALTIPLRPPPDMTALLAQSTMALHRHVQLEREHDPDAEAEAVSTLETVVDRMESPADRMRRYLDPWTSYLILPLFALANAGVVLGAGAFDFMSPMTLGIVLGLVIGKPLGITAAAWLATASGIARKPDQIDWRQLFAASCLCGIGFTMSIFIADAGFTDAAVLTDVKISVLLASVVAGIIGWTVMTRVSAPATQSSRAAGSPVA